jgi:[ribosomal protein S5]-alanine N-acetyltransferase
MPPTATWTCSQLTLRYLRHGDLPAVVAMLGKASVCADVMFGPNSEQETRGYFGPLLDVQQASLDAGHMPTSATFALEEPGGAFVGEAAALEVPFAPGVWMVGYQLDEPFWGRGLGTLAGRFVVQHAVFELGARRITGDCLVTNIASARILTGLGLRPEGVQRQHYMRGDEPVDNLLFGALTDELDAARLRSWQEAFAPA